MKQDAKDSTEGAYAILAAEKSIDRRRNYASLETEKVIRSPLMVKLCGMESYQQSPT